MAPDMDTGLGRARTDAGLTGDKISALDPAAAPVETDAEAAGAPTLGDASRASIGRLMEITWRTPEPETFGAWRQPDAQHHRRLGRILAVWTVILCAVGLAAGVMSLP